MKTNPEPFNADGITVNNWDGMQQVKKKPIVVHAVQLHFPEGFKVTTEEGVMRGRSGDYLMIGVQGEKYPCKKEIFLATYDVVGGDNEAFMAGFNRGLEEKLP